MTTPRSPGGQHALAGADIPNLHRSNHQMINPKPHLLRVGLAEACERGTGQANRGRTKDRGLRKAQLNMEATG